MFIIKSKTLSKILAENLKFYRARENYSQEKLADLSELDRSYISLIETQRRNISIANLERIAKALKIDTYLLLKERFDNE